jgi:hypothetical protein
MTSLHWSDDVIEAMIHVILDEGPLGLGNRLFDC